MTFLVNSWFEVREGTKRHEKVQEGMRRQIE